MKIQKRQKNKKQNKKPSWNLLELKTSINEMKNKREDFHNKPMQVGLLELTS